MFRRKRDNSIEQVLSDVKSGSSLSVVNLNGGKGFKEKMLSQGIIPGAILKLISGGKGAPSLVQINDTKIVIGIEMAQNIVVKTM